MRKESAFRKEVVNFLKSIGAVKVIGVDVRTYPGFPDLIVVMPRGQTMFIELKTAKGIVSDEQAATIGDLQEQCHDAFVLYDCPGWKDGIIFRKL